MSTTHGGHDVMIVEANKQLEDWRGKGAHVLAPVTIQVIPAMHRAVVVAVRIDADPKNKEVYPQKGGGLSLSGIGWKKLADGMGIQMDDKRTGRTDDGKDPNRCEYRCVGYLKAQDGTWRKLIGDKEIRMENVIEELLDSKRQKALDYLDDPKDGPAFRKAFPDPEVWVKEQVRQEALQIKKHLLARAQTGAMARMVKSIGIRETYTAQELAKPFVFPKLVMELDPENEGDRHFLRMQAAGAVDQLYQPPIESMPQKLLPPTDRPLEFYEIPDSTTMTDITPQAQPTPAGTFTAPSPEEVARNDFRDSNAKTQKGLLQDLVTRKHYTGKIAGDMELWSPAQRAGFFEKLIKMADVAKTTAKPDDLPFDN